MKIDRFIDIQKKEYQKAFNEIAGGRKISHWMWYIFPQVKGLGSTSTSVYYGIDGYEEAEEYLNNEYLYNNLVGISKKLLSLETNDPEEVFGYIDAMKLKSCMTLFSMTQNWSNNLKNEKTDVFDKVIDKYYDGEYDNLTIDILND